MSSSVDVFRKGTYLVPFELFLVYIVDVTENQEYWLTQRKYSCLIKRKMHHERGIFKIKIVFNCQGANLNFDILVLIFGCHLAEI